MFVEVVAICGIQVSNLLEASMGPIICMHTLWPDDHLPFQSLSAQLLQFQSGAGHLF